MQGLNFAPIIFVSAKNNQGVRDVVAMAQNLHRQAGHRVGTAELNRVVHEILDKHSPSSPHGHSPKVYYVTQLATYPPTIGLFVNDPTMFDPTYQRFLINRFRETLPFAEVPIKLLIRGKKTDQEEE
jgi:GTP-binding protein